MDAAERKPPLLFWLYAAVFEIAGNNNWKALHAASLLCTLFTMLGLYTIGKRLFDREAGLIAALLYSIFQAWWPGKNLTFQGELPMNLAVVWAYAIAFGRSSSRLRPELLAAGTLFAWDSCSSKRAQSPRFLSEFISFFQATAPAAA